MRGEWWRRRNKKQPSKGVGKEDLHIARSALWNDFLFFFWAGRRTSFGATHKHTLNEMKTLCLLGGLFSSLNFWGEAMPPPVSPVTVSFGPAQTSREDGNMPHSTDSMLILNNLKIYCWIRSMTWRQLDFLSEKKTDLPQKHTNVSWFNVRLNQMCARVLRCTGASITCYKTLINIHSIWFDLIL